MQVVLCRLWIMVLWKNIGEWAGKASDRTSEDRKAKGERERREEREVKLLRSKVRGDAVP